MRITEEINSDELIALPIKIPESLRAIGTDGFKISSLRVNKISRKKKKKKENQRSCSPKNQKQNKQKGGTDLLSPDLNDIELVQFLPIDLRVQRSSHP